MTSKIFQSTILVAIIVLISSLSIGVGVLYNHFTNVQIDQLRDELSLAVTGTEQYGNAFLENVESDQFRITWIDSDGTVLFDTRIDVSNMENHGDREEFQEAMKTGYGSSVRNSITLTERTFYEARQLKDGTVLRISNNQESVVSLIRGMLQPAILIVFIAVILSAVLAKSMAGKIVDPINGLDLEYPLKNDIYEEISPLLRRINYQNIQIRTQMETLNRKADEFQQIIEHMQEGLVLLNGEGTILSINPTAMKIFSVESDSIGKNFLMIDRSHEMRCALNDALDKGRGTTRANLEGRDYQFELSRIESDGNMLGAVVLAFDITESLNAERLRREFTANVSHELKTPLQSIIGSAELLESGLVKSEDTGRFIGHIRKEASRLVSLIQDIIRLSQLDEGAALPVEEVDLLALAEEVKSILEPSAAAKNVTIEVLGNGFYLTGVRRLLQEVIYNLCDNGIKYNVTGGFVRILVENNKLVVSDTGIGIPKEHQDRIFERFYRVDKSHSKSSGGTGLGLSIVKHGVQYHNGDISIESVPGKGTAIIVEF